MIRTICLHKTSQLGLRESNEDVEKYKINLNQNGLSKDTLYGPIDFFTVCDGHGGAEVSKFVASELEDCFMKNNLKYPLHPMYICRKYEHIQNKLINHRNKIAEKCGSTALVLVRYLDKNKKEGIQVINLGDCRAVLSRKGLAIPLSKDHKPFWPDEKKRIDNVNRKYNKNKQIYWDEGDWRIGDLSVSRSFGDLDNVPYVSHIPETHHYYLQNDDDFIVMACDGLWDVMQNHEVVNFIKDHYDDNFIEYYDIPQKYPPADISTNCNIARKLALYAIARGSSDNISILIIFFENK